MQQQRLAGATGARHLLARNAALQIEFADDAGVIGLKAEMDALGVGEVRLGRLTYGWRNSHALADLKRAPTPIAGDVGGIAIICPLFRTRADS